MRRKIWKLTCSVFNLTLKNRIYISRLLPALILTFGLMSKIYCQQVDFNVRDYGATGNGEDYDTKAIVQAIQACHENGGGRVVFPAGTYLSGTFQLLSNVNIHLMPGSKILASPDMKDYVKSGIEGKYYKGVSLIWADGATNISFSGTGIIDGNSPAFFSGEKMNTGWWGVDTAVVRQGAKMVYQMPDGPIAADGPRPGALMMLTNCEHMSFNGITIINSPNWTIQLGGCKYVKFTDINILNDQLIPNSDGLGISQSKYVHVSGCTIIAGDDAVAFSPCADGMCSSDTENVTIVNSVLESRSAGIRLGWGDRDIRNCTFQNLVLNCNRGIIIQGRQQEVIENVMFSDIIINTRLHSGWWGKAEPIHISQAPMDYASFSIEKTEDEVSSIKNIQFNNIQINSEAGILLWSDTPGAVSDVRFNDIYMTVRNGEFNDLVGGNFELRPTEDFKLGVFKHDIPGFYLNGTSDIQIDNFSIRWPDEMPEYYTNAIYGENFDGLKISNAALSVPPGKDIPHVRLLNGKRLCISSDMDKVELVNVE